MNVKIQMLNIRKLLLLPIIVVIGMAYASVGTVFAAGVGTCYFSATSQVPAYAGPCKDQFPKSVDGSGHKLDFSKSCYSVDNNIATVISCDDSRLNSDTSESAACTAQGGTLTDGTCVKSSGGDCNTDSVSASNCDLISKYLQPMVDALAALVGIAVVISIIVGGIQYGSSAGDPQAVTAAKNRIRNAIVALVAFLFLYAMLNFLIPGGLV